MHKHIILVFANLKPSQVNYKILPLSRSEYVEKIIVLRKNYMEINQDKVACLSLPGLMKVRPFYWFVVAFYGIYLIKRHHVTLILNYNIFPHGFNAFFASLFTGIPVIFAEINEDTIHYHKKLLIRPIIKKILSNAAYITVPGSNTENYWKNNGFSKLVTLHSTINTEFFKPDTRIKHNYDFIFIGVFDKNKRPDIVLKAFAELRSEGISATMCMIGFGDLLKDLEKQIKELNLVDSISIIRTNSVLDYLQRSKIFVMASLSEGIPCAMLESMANELIVVVPPVGNISDVVKHGVNGFLHNNTPEEITTYMREAYQTYDSLNFMKKQARETIINKHSYQFATKRWDELLLKISLQ